MSLIYARGISIKQKQTETLAQDFLTHIYKHGFPNRLTVCKRIRLHLCIGRPKSLSLFVYYTRTYICVCVISISAVSIVYIDQAI